MRATEDPWSTQSPLGSPGHALTEREPTAAELETELAEWMPAPSAARLINVFQHDFPDVI